MNTNEWIFYGAILSWILIRHFWFKINLKNRTEPKAANSTTYNRYNAILEKFIPYYTRLSLKGRNTFVSRLVQVLEKTPIAGKDGFEANEEAKVVIAGCITQLTFGFKQAYLPFLKGIGIYPNVFYSKLLRADVKGMAMGNGIVFMSYSDFVNGYKLGKDTYNLGLHEFAHILQLQAEELSLFDERLSSYFEKWKSIGHPVFESMRAQDDHFFRDYASTNFAEFFSVCIENFFEVPEAFEKEFPELYYHLCYLMKQNPLNAQNDYAFNLNDVQYLNKTTDLKLPYFGIWKTQKELFFWHYFGSFVALFAGLCFCIFISISEKNQFISLRILVVSLAITLGARLAIYQNMNAIINKEYLKHFALRLAPLLAFISLVFELLFMDV